MIHVIAATEVKEGCLEEFLKALDVLVPSVRAEKGCISYEPCLDYQSGLSAQQHDPNRITFVETWESMDALKTHLAAPHMNVYRDATRALVKAKTYFNVVEPAK